VRPDQELRVVDDTHEQIPKIDDGPWPMFPADLTSIAVAVATQAAGTVLIFEKMFENRLFFTDKLVSMGARIILCDPHRAVVTGPCKLRGQRMESPDIRAGMAMLLASLCAEGPSTIGAIYQIDKGYERIDERLRAPGVRGHGSAVLPVEEALAHVTLEASGRPLLVSKVDLSQARIAGLEGDLGARFLDELAQTAGLTLHVRLVEGSDSQHVLEAI